MMNKDYISKLGVIFFLTNGFMIGEGYTQIFEVSGHYGFAAMILGLLLGIGMLYLLNKKESQNWLMIIISIVYLFFASITLSTLVNSYYLVNTPTLIIVFSFLIVAFYLAFYGQKTIFKVTEMFLPIALFFIFLTIIFFIPSINCENLLPQGEITLGSFLKASIYFALFSVSPLLLLKDIELNFKQKIKVYIGSSFLSIIMALLITLVLGGYLIKEYSFPEYIALRSIKLLDFVENVENILFLPWYFNLFLLASLSISNLLNLTNKKIVIIILLVITILLSLVFNNNYEYTLSFSKNYIYILLIINLLNYIK